jgi:dihydroorotate dehydrogenase
METLCELAPQHKHGLTLARPVMNAAGTLGFVGEARGWVDLAALGAFVTNPLTWSPRTPAAPPNAVALAEGVLVHTGLPNPGVRAALRQYAREWAREFRRLRLPVIVHLAATTPDDVQRGAEALERADGVAGLELGLRDDVTAAELRVLVRAARGGPPLVVRLPLAGAPALAEAAVQAGADALIVAAPARAAVEVEGRTVAGRLYGPGQFPAALTAVQAVLALGLGVPVVGAGGVFSAEQAQAMLVAGAAAVQLDAVVWQAPGWIREVGVPNAPG